MGGRATPRQHHDGSVRSTPLVGDLIVVAVAVTLAALWAADGGVEEMTAAKTAIQVCLASAVGRAGAPAPASPSVTAVFLHGIRPLRFWRLAFMSLWKATTSVSFASTTRLLQYSSSAVMQVCASHVQRTSDFNSRASVRSVGPKSTALCNSVLIFQCVALHTCARYPSTRVQQVQFVRLLTGPLTCSASGRRVRLLLGGRTWRHDP